MPTNRLSQIFGITSFGESHGTAIGLVIDSPPPNLDFPFTEITAALQKRQANTAYRTQRIEKDDFEILSGVFEGKTTGMPICIIVRNRDAISSDYDALKDVFRPSHADFSWTQKYAIHDYRGGGRSSGRTTLANVIAGCFCDNILGDILISITCPQIGTMIASPSDAAIDNPFHWPETASLAELYAYMDQIKAAGDSVGGMLQVTIAGVPLGLGDPLAEKLNANLAKAMLSIGSIKGILFGDGLLLAALKGSEANDQMDSTGFLSNHNGGISGGVTNGNDITFTLVVKAVPSISLPQKTIDKLGKDSILTIQGRHDVCHIPRLIPVVEAMIKLCLADAIQYQKLVKSERKELPDFRENLDKLDEDLLLLLYRRKMIVAEVRDYKKMNDISEFDPKREDQIRHRASAMAKELGLDPSATIDVINATLKVCKIC